MFDRSDLIRAVVQSLDGDDCLVSALGYISRDAFGQTAHMRERSFYCMGSMGSVVPLALGIALARPAGRTVALEGDGSMLMSLGSLATVRRYAPPGLVVVVVDNGVYETTGGQPAQPEGFRIEALCEAAGLSTVVAEEEAAVHAFLRDAPAPGPRVLVAKVRPGAVAPRVADDPATVARRFHAWCAGHAA